MARRAMVEEIDQSIDCDACFLEDLKTLAKHYIQRFFNNKTYHAGGHIPAKLLCDERYISLILNTDICGGMETIYESIASNYHYTEEQMHKMERQGQIPNDVKHILSLLEECAALGIPRSFAVGIIIMHLELCEGMSIKINP